MARWNVADEDSFWQEIEGIELDHGMRDPIFSAHLIKTATASREELSLADSSCRSYLLAGINRFFHSNVKQKHARRLARQAIDLVARDYE